MKKNFLKLFTGAAFVCAMFFSTNTMAQSGPRLGVGLNAGVPTSSAYSFVIGADLRYQFDVDQQLSIPITAGYMHMVGKSQDIGGTKIQFGDYGYIPLKIGAKYFFDPSGSGLYGLAELGAGFGTKSGSGTSFVYSPAVGYSWSSGLDLGVKYEGLSNNGSTGWFGLRLAYGFSL